MSNIYKGMLGLIGNTPLVEVANIEKELGLEDWQHLYRWCGNSPEKKRIHDRIAELGGE